jgi:MFS family permease
MLIKNLININNGLLSNKDVFFFSLFFFLHASSVGINIVTFSIFLNDYNIIFNDVIKMISTQFIGGVFCIPFANYICLRFKTIYTICVGAMIRSIGVIVLGWSTESSFWYIGLAMSGIGSSMIFTCVTYILKYSSNKKYLYDTSFIIYIFALGVCISSFIINFLQLKIDHVLFIISGIISLLSVFVISHIKDLYIPIKLHTMNLTLVSKKSYTSILTILYLSYTVTSLIYFMDKYLENQNHFIIIYMMMGVLLFIFPATYFYIRLNNNSVFLIIITILSSFIIFCIPISLKYHSSLLISLMYFILGGLFACIFIIHIKILRSIIFQQSLVYISSIVILAYNLGCFMGIRITNNIVNIYGKNGLVISILSMSFVYLIFLLYILKKRDLIEVTNT